MAVGRVPFQLYCGASRRAGRLLAIRNHRRATPGTRSRQLLRPECRLRRIELLGARVITAVQELRDPRRRAPEGGRELTLLLQLRHRRLECEHLLLQLRVALAIERGSLNLVLGEEQSERRNLGIFGREQLLERLDQETIAAKVAERDHGRTVRSAHRQRHCVAVDCDRGEHACCRRDDQPRAVRLA